MHRLVLYCDAVDNSKLGVSFNPFGIKHTNSEPVVHPQEFTVELWIHIRSFLSSNLIILLTHESYWRIIIDPLSQTWSIAFFSVVTNSYRLYPTDRFVPMNTWSSLAITFKEGKFYLVTHPHYQAAEYSLNPTFHSFTVGSTSELYLGDPEHRHAFIGRVYSVKYWNKAIDIDSESIKHPEGNVGTPPEGLTHHFTFTYKNLNRFAGMYRAIYNNGEKNLETIRFGAAIPFSALPSFCNEAIVFTNNICRDKGYYLKLTDGFSRGLAVSLGTHLEKLTFETWMFSTDPSQESTLARIESRGVVEFSITISAMRLICYPDINVLTDSSYAVIGNLGANRWLHVVCMLNNEISETTLHLYDGLQTLTNIRRDVTIRTQEQTQYSLVVGERFLGYIRELRLWNNVITEESILRYRYQTLDITDSNINSILNYYYPFSTETDTLFYKSGIDMSDVESIILVNADDYNNIYYTNSPADVIICSVGLVHVNNECLKPHFEFTITEHESTYILQIQSKIYQTHPSYDFDWEYPYMFPTNDQFQNYIHNLIDTMTDNTIIIFKPALLEDRFLNFTVRILPQMYADFIPEFHFSQSIIMRHMPNCPSLSLTKENIFITNLIDTNIEVELIFSACTIAYTVSSIDWSIQDEDTTQFFIIPDPTKQRIIIPQSSFDAYKIGEEYIIEAVTKISMISPQGEAYEYTITNQIKVIRDHYELIFTSTDITQVHDSNTMTIFAKHEIRSMGYYNLALEPASDTIQCSNNFPSELCNQISIGVALSPFERAELGMKPDIYTFTIKGTWRNIVSEKIIEITLLPPYVIIENKNVSIFYEYTAYQAIGNEDALGCKASEMEYEWYFLGSEETITDHYELKLNKADMPVNGKLIVNCTCQTTEKYTFTFLEITDSRQPFDIIVHSNYSFSAIEEAIIINLNENDPGDYLISIKDIIDNVFIPAQVIYSKNEEIEVYLPYTTQIQVRKYKENSIEVKTIDLDMIIPSDINLDDYIDIQRNNINFHTLMYIILHMRNTMKEFSPSQKTKLFNYLATFNVNQLTDKTFIELPLVALKELSKSITEVSEYIEWLNAISHCLYSRNKFLTINYQDTITSISRMLNDTMIPYFEKESNETLKLNVVRIVKDLIEIMQKWLIEEMLVYEAYVVNTELYSVGGYTFANHVPKSAAEVVVSFVHVFQSAEFIIDLDFISKDVIPKNEIIEKLVKFGMTEVAYNTDYLKSPSIYSTERQISKSQLNFSLYHHQRNTLHSLTHNQSLDNQLFRPTISFNDLIYTNYTGKIFCHCPNNDSSNATCKTYIDKNNSKVLCQFDSPGLSFVGLNCTHVVKNDYDDYDDHDDHDDYDDYKNSFGDIFQGNFSVLIYYLSLLFLLLFSALIFGDLMDTKDAVVMTDIPSKASLVIQYLETEYIKSHNSPYSFCSGVWLVFKYFQPFTEIFIRYTPINPRFNRLALTLLLCQLISTFTFYFVKSNTSNSYIDALPSFLYGLFLSFLLWVVYLVALYAYEYIMEMIYKVNVTIKIPDTEKRKVVKENQLDDKEGDLDEESQEFSSPKPCEDDSIAKEATDLRKQTEEGRVLPIINGEINSASYLSAILNVENRYIGDKKYVTEDGKTIEVKNYFKPNFDSNAVEQTISLMKAQKPLVDKQEIQMQNENEVENKNMPLEVMNIIYVEMKKDGQVDSVNLNENQLMAIQENNLGEDSEDTERRLIQHIESIHIDKYKPCNTDIENYKPKDKNNRMCITELNDSSSNFAPKTLQEIKRYKITALSLVRDYVLVMLGAIVSGIALYYVASGVVETRAYILKAWIIFTLVAIGSVLIMWNSLYVVAVGILAFVAAKKETNFIGKILAFIIPTRVQSMMRRYSLNCK